LDGLVRAQFNTHQLAGMTFVLVQDGEVTLQKGYCEIDLLTGEKVDLGDYVHQFDLPNAFDSPLTMSHLMTHTPGLEDGTG
jgi:CubicO group peptidase (beta-lactamase class C family)